MNSHAYLDHGLAIFHTRLKSQSAGSHASFNYPNRPFLTISREACAGATTLGRHLLALLNAQKGEEDQSWMFLDRDLLTHALTTHHLPEYLASYLPEDRVSEIKGMIGEIVGLHPPIGELERHVSEAILQIAQLGCVIFAGRAAHLVTHGLPGGFHIRLVAPLELRIRRKQQLQDCDHPTAERELLESDKARRRYVQSNFEQDIDDPHAYDLVINTDHILPETAAHLVLRAMQDRLMSATVSPGSGQMAATAEGAG